MYHLSTLILSYTFIHFSHSFFLLFVLLLIIRQPPISSLLPFMSFFFFNDTATTEIYTLSSHLGISYAVFCLKKEEHTSQLQSLRHLVCRLLLENKTREVCTEVPMTRHLQSLTVIVVT